MAAILVIQSLSSFVCGFINTGINGYPPALFYSVINEFSGVVGQVVPDLPSSPQLP